MAVYGETIQKKRLAWFLYGIERGNMGKKKKFREGGGGGRKRKGVN